MKIIVAGAGTIGRHVAEMLQRERHDVTIIDRSREALELVEELDIQAVKGSANHPDTLIQAGVAEAQLFIALTQIDETNLISAMTAGRLGAAKSMARVRQPFYMDSARVPYRSVMGIDLIVSPEYLAALEIVQHINQPAAIAIENFADGRLHLRQFLMDAGHAFTGLPLAVLNPHLPDDLLIAMISRGADLIIPWGDVQLMAGDRVTVLGLEESVDKFGETFDAVESEEKIDSVMIMGGGIKGHFLAQMLESRRYRVTILEREKSRCEFLSSQLPNTTVIWGDGTRLPLLKEERAPQFDLFIAATGDDENNLMSCLQVKSLGGRRVYTVMNRPDYAETVQQFGIDVAISPRRLMGNRVLALINRGKVRAFSTIEDGRAEVTEFIALAGTPIVGRPLREISIPRGVLLGLVLKGGAPKVPRGDTVIEPGDVVVTLALEKNSDDVEQLFGLKAAE